MVGDILCGINEPIPRQENVRAHHPMYDYMKKVYRPPYNAEEIMVPVFVDGKQVYESNLNEARERAKRGLNSLEPEYKRFSNPHIYKVSLSDSVYLIKKELLEFHQDRGNNSYQKEI
jgi:nicotinate phosphoribosyltransferase